MESGLWFPIFCRSPQIPHLPQMPAHGYVLGREKDSFVNGPEDESSTLALALTQNLQIPGASFVCPGCQPWAQTAGPGSPCEVTDNARQQAQEGGGPGVSSLALRAETLSKYSWINSRRDKNKPLHCSLSLTFLTLLESCSNQDKRPDASRGRVGLGPPWSTGLRGWILNPWLFPHVLGTPTSQRCGGTGAAAGRRCASEWWITPAAFLPAPVPRRDTLVSHTVLELGMRALRPFHFSEDTEAG